MIARHGFRGEMIAEALAVAIIITLGDSAAAMLILHDPSPYATACWGVCIAWGLAVTLAIYVTGAVSGTHANPAVTLAPMLFRQFPRLKVLPHVAAQVLGAMIGAALVHQLFGPVIGAYNQAHNQAHGLTRAGGGAAGVFFTAPGAHITPVHAFWDDVVLTGILLLGSFAITDEFNTQAPMANASAPIIGLLVACIGASAGYLEGWPINPARDHGPRIFCWLTGWGSSAFSGPGHYRWVPIAGPLVRGVSGAAVYHYLVRPYLPPRARQ